jgi:hypothetical protein
MARNLLSKAKMQHKKLTRVRPSRDRPIEPGMQRHMVEDIARCRRLAAELRKIAQVYHIIPGVKYEENPLAGPSVRRTGTGG